MSDIIQKLDAAAKQAPIVPVLVVESAASAGPLAEAAVLADRCRQLGLTHLHAHFGTNSADVVRYARMLGADSQAIVDSLDPKARVTGPVKLSPGALHSAHSIPQSGADDDRASSTSWGWLIAIVLVLAAGVAYAFWQGWLPQQWLAFDWLPKLSK